MCTHESLQHEAAKQKAARLQCALRQLNMHSGQTTTHVAQEIVQAPSTTAPNVMGTSGTPSLRTLGWAGGRGG